MVIACKYQVARLIQFRQCFVLFFILFSISEIFAQKEANIWYFGFNAGIDFNSGAPVALTNGQIKTLEGCASVADANGNLLFYTDGTTVYNKKHNVMTNGTGLLGDNSSSQSAVVVPLPGSSTQYYIFTVDAIVGPDGLCYSIVDMSLQGGDGELIKKNIQILTPASEKITVTQHRNKKDFWIITQKFNTNQMQAFLLTAAGLNTNAVVSSIGGVIGGSTANSQGYLKVSPDGSRLALACDFCGYINLMNFDNSSGVINNLIQLNYYRPYGVEFSPNNRYLYVSGWGNQSFLVQLDLKFTTPSSIKSSEVTLANGTVPYALDALQLGPDGKIYVATNREYLNSINNPNSGGNACNYVTKSVDLKGRSCGAGLPTYIQSLFNLPLISFDRTCFKDSTQFYLSNLGIDSIFWDFGDPASGASNYSHLFTPAHQYSDSGHFKVSSILCIGVIRDTVENLVHILNPRFSLGHDTTLCPGAKILLNVNKPGYQLKWQDNSNSINYLVNQTGVFWAETSLKNCQFRDSIQIVYVQLPSLELGNDSSVCGNESILLDAGIGSASYLWQDGSLTKTYLAKIAGQYKVSVNYQGCILKDSVVISHRPIPHVDLGKDTQICSGNWLTLQAKSLGNVKWRWQDESTSKSILVNKSGLYWLQLDSNGCSSRDSIKINVLPSPLINLGGTQRYCKGDSLLIDLGSNADTYLWYNGSSDSRITVKDSGMIYLTGKIGICSNSDSALIEFINCNCFVYIPSAFTPQEDGLNDEFTPLVNCPVTDYQFIVFNRWGDIVFESKNTSEGWNGKVNRQDAPQDLYGWTLQFIAFKDRKLKMYRGTLQLLK